jgi:GNAT superfamily N-acetyltransferase
VSGLRLAWIAADDARMRDIHALRHEVLFAPFGLPRDDSWDDAGVDRLHLVAVHDAQDGSGLPGEPAAAILGYLSLLLEAEGMGHVRQVSVREDRQGAGIGRALMAEAEAEAQRRGLVVLWLHARVSAEAFYHRLGSVTTSDGTFPSGRTGMPHVRMEKRLLAG